jgi:hypothetical protein
MDELIEAAAPIVAVLIIALIVGKIVVDAIAQAVGV